MKFNHIKNYVQKNAIYLLLLVLFESFMIFGCKGITQSEPYANEISTVTDVDGNIYQTVKIGDQWWMAENLKTTKNPDGTILSGAYAYNNDESYVLQYGRLYNWQAAMNACMDGWHLPSLQEWETLMESLGDDSGNKLKVGGSSGFEGKLAGHRFYEGGYGGLGVAGEFWSSIHNTSDHCYILNLFNDNAQAVISGFGVVGAVSVRYIKDED